MSELKEHLFVPYSELQEGDELTDAITIAKSYYLKSEVDDVIAKKDAEIQALKQKLMAYGDANTRLAKENTDLKLIAESRGTEVAQLKSDIADLQDRLRASEKQNEDLINSASQIMILQDKALASKERQG